MPRNDGEGRKEVWKRWYVEYAPIIMRYVQESCGCPEGSADIVVEVFFCAFLDLREEMESVESQQLLSYLKKKADKIIEDEC